MRTHKMNRLLFITLVVGLTVSFHASARIGLGGIIPAFGYDMPSMLNPTAPFQIKRGDKYDESKDPALRKGTENEEMPQSSFFAVPAAVIGIIGLVLFFTREKK